MQENRLRPIGFFERKLLRHIKDSWRECGVNPIFEKNAGGHPGEVLRHAELSADDIGIYARDKSERGPTAEDNAKPKEYTFHGNCHIIARKLVVLTRSFREMNPKCGAGCGGQLRDESRTPRDEQPTNYGGSFTLASAYRLRASQQRKGPVKPALE
jgi:hypothetical protein